MIRTTELPNGVRIVTEAMPGLLSATLGIWVATGGRHERAEQNGIAHFLEHMAFKGTARRSALDIAEAIEDVGGYINAYTGREMTAYYARVLSDDIALALDVVADIVLNPVFDPQELEVERHVILSEIGQAHDTPDDIVFDWLQETAYPDQPMGRTILGPSERVRAFTRNDLAAFTEAQYGPDRLIVAAAGGVDHDAIVAEAAERLGHLRPRPRLAPEGAAFAGGERRVEKALEQAQFTLGFEAPCYTDDKVYAAHLFASALGGGMSSRLFQELREVRGLAYTVSAHASAWTDTGLMTVYAGTSGEDLAELAQATADEIRKTAAGLSQAELDRARAQMKAGLLMGLESASTRAERLARLMMIWGRVPDLSETLARIDGVTLDEARSYGTGLTRPAMALYGPVAGAPELDRLTARLAA